MKTELNKLIAAISLFSLVIIAGCKKNDNAANSFGRIKSTMINLYGQDTTVYNVVYTYDNQGRPTMRQYYDTFGTPGGKYIYTYGGDSVLFSNVSTTGYTTPLFTYHLNAQGYVAFDNLGNTFGYNSDGQISAYSYSTYMFPIIINNGNIISSTGIYTGGTTLFTYLTDKIEYRNYGFTNYTHSPLFDYGMATFCGKNNKNLISTAISGYDTIVYSYKFDNKGRVNQETQNSVNNYGLVHQTISFTYFN